VNDIPICTAATAVELDTEETIILQFGQGLWFGDRLNHSLINPNQCRSYGISVCDDPTDPNRDIGMELPANYFLPFRMRGTTCLLEVILRILRLKRLLTVHHVTKQIKEKYLGQM